MVAMTLVIPPGYGHVDISLRHEAYQRDAHVTFGVAGAGANVEDVAGEVGTAFSTTMTAQLDSQVRMRLVEVTIGQDGGDPIVISEVWNLVGGTSGASVPPALAVGISKRTMFGGRRNSGRMFMPWWLQENQVDEVGVIIPAAVSARQTAVTQFLSVLEADGFPMVLLHRTGNTPVPSPTPVTSLQVDPVISTQVRRQVRNV